MDMNDFTGGAAVQTSTQDTTPDRKVEASDSDINGFTGAGDVSSEPELGTDSDNTDDLDFGNDLGESDSVEGDEVDSSGDEAETDGGADAGAADDADSETETPDEEADADGGEDEAETPVEKPDLSKKQIPKSRLDKEILKRKAAAERADKAEQRLRELEARMQSGEQAPAPQPQATEVDFDALASQLQESVLEGDAAKTAEVMRKIAEAGKTPPVDASKQVEATLAQKAFTETAQRLSDTYEVLDPQSEAYDQSTVDAVLATHRRIVETGVSPATALEQAVDSWMEKLGYTTEEAEDEVPAPAPVKDKPETVAKKDKVKKQPPVPNKAVADTTTKKLDVFAMTDAEFDNLSDEEFAEIAGFSL